MKICMRCRAPRDGEHCDGCKSALVDVPELRGYQAEKYVARGGQGTVYRCVGEGQQRVIKIIDPADLHPDARDKATQWFENEVAALEQLNHPHVIALHAQGRVGGLMFLVTSFLEGTLRHLLTPAGDRPRVPLALPRIVRYAAQLADALTYMHDQGVLHRDVKPANIGLDRHDRIKLFDFGAAGLHTGSRLTTIGAPMSLLFAAPEQLEGRSTSAQTDIYGFGAVLYEMIAGQTHRPESVGVRQDWPVFYKQPIPDLPPDPTRPPELDDLIMRCLHPDAGARIQHTWHLQITLAELADKLDGGFGEVRARWTTLDAEVPRLAAEQASLNQQIATGKATLAQQTRALADVRAEIASLETRRIDAEKKAVGFEVAARDMRRQFEEANAQLRTQRAEADAIEARTLAAEQRTAEATRQVDAARRAQEAAEAARATADAARQKTCVEEAALKRQIAELTQREATAEQALASARAERDTLQMEAEALTRSRAKRKTAQAAVGMALLVAGLVVGFGLAVMVDDAGPRGIDGEAPPPPPADAGVATPDAWVLPEPGQPVARETVHRPALHFIPAGTFLMGSPVDEAHRDKDQDETQHRVCLTRPFLMMRTEVTQAQWHAVMGNRPSRFTGDQRPVERISWYDAVAFANKLSQLEALPACYTLSACSGVAGGGCMQPQVACNGYYRCKAVELDARCVGYRLPTEAEWEYAARAGATGPQHGPPETVAWFKSTANGATHPVGEKAANAWGLHDMLGNVWEWTGDAYHVYPKALECDPHRPQPGEPDKRMLRGGAWNVKHPPRLADRGWNDTQMQRVNTVGLRLVRTATAVADGQKRAQPSIVDFLLPHGESVRAEKTSRGFKLLEELKTKSMAPEDSLGWTVPKGTILRRCNGVRLDTAGGLRALERASRVTHDEGLATLVIELTTPAGVRETVTVQSY